MATQSMILAAPLNSTQLTRLSGGVKLGPVKLPFVWPASDGFVTLSFLFGSALGVFTRKLMHYICERGFCDERTRDKDWIGYGALLFSGKEPIEEYERIKGIVATFTRAHTKAELLCDGPGARLSDDPGYHRGRSGGKPAARIPRLLAIARTSGTGTVRLLPGAVRKIQRDADRIPAAAADGRRAQPRNSGRANWG